jgi:hypothetical protein
MAYPRLESKNSVLLAQFPRSGSSGVLWPLLGAVRFCKKYLSAFQDGRKVEITAKGYSDEKKYLLCADVFRRNSWNIDIVRPFKDSFPNFLKRKLVTVATVAPLTFPKAVSTDKTNITSEYVLPWARTRVSSLFWSGITGILTK